MNARSAELADSLSLGGGGAELGDGNGAQQSGAVPPIDQRSASALAERSPDVR